jgi:transposase
VFNEDVEHIKELMSYCKFNKKQTTQQKNHLESLTSKDGDKFSIKELKKSIEESIKKEQKIIEQVQTLIDSTDEYRVAYENITSIKGVGQIAGIALLHLFLKYPEANQRQITSLVGLNPIYRQSGTSVQSGYRIAKTGAGLYRGVLFMATLSAIQYDKNFKAVYDRLKLKGKHSTSAQIAVMRKIILTAHSLYKNNKEYDENFNSQEDSKMQ